MADTYTEFSITLPSGDMYETIVTELEAGSPELVDLLVFLVAEKTPVATGALQSSIEGIPNQAHGDPDLAYVYASDGPQLDEYSRIYAPYVEGGPLGLSSNTIAHPAQMFENTAQQNTPEIETWALEQLQRGLDRWAAGEGIS